VFYATYLGLLAVAAAIVLVPGAPLVPILFLSQALNAVLLLVLLPFMRGIAADESIMGVHRLGPAGRVATAVAIAMIAVAVACLGGLTVT
jgi:Mn2+/Fe2+ NRAMP family transporter